VALPAFARRTPLLQQSIDISCLPFPQQQTCSSVFAAVDPCWDRRTDRPTDTAYYASCANEPDINGSVVRFPPLAESKFHSIAVITIIVVERYATARTHDFSAASHA